ncbi:LysR family transcriptional regulator [Salmonella enterica subsp. enterica serovar Choleraesuis]|nr:LysR family transcriptional regulator [Salmonella enterica subsp. enterica serovar Choleraesuis]
MDIPRLKKFVVVAQEGNVSRAARRLHISQPALSKQLSLLEEDVGVALLLRHTRPLQLTPAGVRFYDDACALLAKIEEMKSTARHIALGERQLLTIGFVPSALYGGFPGVMRRLQKRRKDLEVRWIEMASAAQIAALKTGAIDLGFGRLALSDPGIEQVTLREERLMLALALSHPLASDPTPVKFSQLSTFPMVLYPDYPAPSYASQLQEWLDAAGARPSSIQRVRELQTALGLAAAEAGYCVIPASARHLRRDLVYRLIDDIEARVPVVMNYRRNEVEIAGLICALTREMYAEQPGWLEPEYNQLHSF